VVHKAIPGGYDVTLREGKRTAVHGERPFFDPENSESLTQREERLKADGSSVKTNGVHKFEAALNN
jgi:sulfonate dioxygenase